MDEDPRRLSMEEFDSAWRPLRDRLFSTWGGAPQVEDIAYDDYPIGPPSWKRVAIPQQLTWPWGHSRYWPEVSNDRIDEYAPLLRTLQERGGRSVCLSADWRSSDGTTGPHCLVSPQREKIELLAEEFASSCHATFDTSGEWGLSNLIDDAGVLAGTDEFMEHFLRNAGGLETVKQHFYNYDTRGWRFPRPNDQHVVDAFYTAIGWERPEYPPDAFNG